MSNFDSSLSECLGFSQIMISELFNVSIARELISPKFPIGVDIMYRPFFIIFSLAIFILLMSCAPVNNRSVENIITGQDPKQNIKTENNQNKKHSLEACHE